VTVAACGGSSDVPLPQPSTVTEPAPAVARGGIVVVLPAADQLDQEERIRVRLLVERAITTALPGSVRPELIEPASAATVGAVVEAAARRVDAVCVLGVSGVAALTAVRELYPALHGCVLPTASGSTAVAATSGDPVPPAPPVAVPGGPSSTAPTSRERPTLDGIDVDLHGIGVTLGRSAREVAGSGTVVVLDGGDPLLDRRWSLGVMDGAGIGVDGAPAPLRVVRSVAEVLALVEGVGAGVGVGVAGPPGSAAASAQRPGIRRGDGGEDDAGGPALLPVGAVVLDTSPGTDALATLLLDAGIPVVVPRSLVNERLDDPAIIARWRVRWDIALVPLLRRAAAAVGADATPPNGPIADDGLEGLLALDEGPALVAARARSRSDDLR